MNDWNLRGTTGLTAERWLELASLLTGWRAAWADLDGMHIDVPLPGDLPVTSHVWAWTTGGWLRVRVDGHRWWAGALFHGEGITSDLWRAQPVTTDVVADRIRSWAADDGRVQQMRIAEGVIRPTMWQLVPVGTRTAVYIGGADTYAGP